MHECDIQIGGMCGIVLYVAAIVNSLMHQQVKVSQTVAIGIAFLHCMARSSLGAVSPF